MRVVFFVLHTEIFHLGHGKDLTKIKKLGSLLDDERDMSRFNNLCQCALKNFRTTEEELKIFVYQTFAEPILQYNSSTRVSNKQIENTIDNFQEKHLRRDLNNFTRRKSMIKISTGSQIANPSLNLQNYRNVTWDIYSEEKPRSKTFKNSSRPYLKEYEELAVQKS